MCEYFLNNVNVYDASDDAYIVFLALFAFVDVNVEYSLLLADVWTPPPYLATVVSSNKKGSIQ